MSKWHSSQQLYSHIQTWDISSFHRSKTKPNTITLLKLNVRKHSKHVVWGDLYKANYTASAYISHNRGMSCCPTRELIHDICTFPKTAAFMCWVMQAPLSVGTIHTASHFYQYKSVFLSASSKLMLPACSMLLHGAVNCSRKLIHNSCPCFTSQFTPIDKLFNSQTCLSILQLNTVWLCRHLK